jgi:hypothetical protein
VEVGIKGDADAACGLCVGGDFGIDGAAHAEFDGVDGVPAALGQTGAAERGRP